MGPGRLTGNVEQKIADNELFAKRTALCSRRALLAWAERNIEEDYDSEFRFGDRPLEPLQTLDTRGRVI